MSSESDTPNIDEVKQTLSPGSPFMINLQTLITTIIQRITHLFIYVILAGYVLYTCKVCQSNLFPTETACKPYTNSLANVESIKTNIFETFMTRPKMSQKLHFSYEKNDRNIILDSIRQLKEEPTSTATGAYIMTIIQSSLTINYIFFNIFFNLLNQLPEFLILIIGPAFFLMFIPILLIINIINVFISWFTQLKWFFKKNTNDKLSGVPTWSTITILEPMEFFIAFVSIGFFMFLGFIILPPLLPIISTVLVILTIFSLNAYHGTLNGEEIGLFGVIQLVFTYYKVPLTTIIALMVIIYTNSILGTTSGVFCVITVILIYFGIISFDLFKGIPEKYLSPMVPSLQAIKTCSAGVIQAGGNKKDTFNTNAKSFNSKLKQISKQLSKTK